MGAIEDPRLCNADRRAVRPIDESDRAAGVWVGFNNGQKLKDCESSTALIKVLKGRIRPHTASEQILGTGQTVALKPYERHALTALADSVVQLVLVLHPRYHRLASEIGLGSDKN